MITMNKETKKAASIIFIFGIFIIFLSLSNGCAPLQGPPGVPGTNAVVASFNAPNGSCGVNLDGSNVNGTVVMTAQDTLGLGVWAPGDADQSSFLVCNGENGQTGATGATGANGQNATPVSTVQFCTGYTTTYPSTFPEFGIVINDAIYAVYWNGSDAWLAQIVPGYYASTSTSAPCDFTVNPNGTITDN